MYTVGQVAKFLGISRDTLKFYEEKELIKPKQDEENGYRKYSLEDINKIITINFYRDIDIEVKRIQQIKKEANIESIEEILDEKQNKLEEEIEYKKALLKRIKEIKENCKSIKENLNKFVIREMKPIIVTSEVEINKEDFGETYTQILDKYDYSTRIKKPVNLSGLARIIYINGAEITKERYIFYKQLDDELNKEGETFSYQECLYTVIAVPFDNEEENVDENMGKSIMEISTTLGYTSLGITFINLLFNGYHEDENIQYLEVYTPVKKI